ncbi:MAG: rod shape-determining protein MreC [Zetaproteobacteria bacterium]|nr:MAG: rod shape-determining protein MreC [Zetaproteobacteria bacterium]
MKRLDFGWTTLMVLALVFLVLVYRVPAASWVTLGLGPVLEVLHAPVRWMQDASLWFEERQQLQQEYAVLKQRLEQQAAIIQRTHSLEEENRQLKALLGIANIEGFNWQATKVLGRSPDTMSQRLLVQAPHARIDDVVVSSEGLVGLVVEAREGYAVVRTILDASLSVPVTLPGSHLAGLVRGQGNELVIDFLPWDEAPKVGDVFVTSGAGGLFPPGIPVARVLRVDPVPGTMYAHVQGSPVAHWQKANWLAIADRRAIDRP